MHPVVQVAVVESDQHGTLGRRAARQVSGELGGGQRLVAGPRQARNLGLEHVRRGCDHAARRGDMVVHQHGDVRRIHAARSASHFK
ncbi:hypothetical protein G6F63_016490 [Rhizopus arrhizus]|nr:hypothetical protein G6F66_015315 [Rhizopus arrhizus]KAG1308113.1 hypothetical protein G6F63_016490 [Rhizopus arrhizus]